MKVEFTEGGKPENPEKNPRSQIEIDKSQPTCGARESNPGRASDDRFANLTPLIKYCVLQHNHVYKVVLTQEIKIHVRIDLYYGHIKI